MEIKKNKKALPDNEKHGYILKVSKKLASKFPVKDFQHHNNVVYYGKCRNPTRIDDYICEIDRIVIERLINHNKQDEKSHMLKHSRDK